MKDVVNSTAKVNICYIYILLVDVLLNPLATIMRYLSECLAANVVNGII